MGVLCQKWIQILVYVCIVVGFNSTVLASDENWTSKHEKGRCAIRGQCGAKSFFGGDLPCPDNGLAQQPGSDTRAKLVEICGDRWSTGEVCCDDEQVSFRGIGLDFANSY